MYRIYVRENFRCSKNWTKFSKICASWCINGQLKNLHRLKEKAQNHFYLHSKVQLVFILCDNFDLKTPWFLEISATKSISDIIPPKPAQRSSIASLTISEANPDSCAGGSIRIATNNFHPSAFRYVKPARSRSTGEKLILGFPQDLGRFIFRKSSEINGQLGRLHHLRWRGSVN